MNQNKVNFETLLYGIIFVLALLVRFIHLGQPPLNQYEAVPALQALSISRGQETMMGDQPAYVMLTTGLFRVMDATDFLARFWPAFIGAGIVWVAFLLRKRLPGRTGLIAALFLAVDPALVAISRTAGGQSLTVVFGLLAAVLLFERKWIIGGVLLGLAVAGGVSFWLGLMILLIILILMLPGGTPFSTAGSFKNREWLAGVAALTAVAVSTGLFAFPNGISGIGSGLVSFINRWDSISIVPIEAALTVFAVTYFPLLILAGFGYFLCRRQHPVISRILFVWFITATLLVVILPGREISDWVWAVFPLVGFASLGIDQFLRRVSESNRPVLIGEIVLTVSLIIFSILNLLAYFFNSYGDAVVDRNRLIGAGLPILLLMIMTAFLAWGWSPRSALQGLGLGLGLLLCVAFFSAGMKSTGNFSQVSAIAWKPQSIVVDEELLVRQVEELSIWNHGQREAIDIEVIHYDNPALHWALRSFPSVTWDLQYSQLETPSIIIAPDYQQIGSTTLYRGQGITWAQYPSYSRMGFEQWVQWLFYRQAPVDEIRLVLYARNDLFKQ
jgi:hypothetical protein